MPCEFTFPLPWKHPQTGLEIADFTLLKKAECNKMLSVSANADMSPLYGWLKTQLEEEFFSVVDHFIMRDELPLTEESEEKLCNNIAGIIWESKEMTEFRGRMTMIAKEQLQKSNEYYCDKDYNNTVKTETLIPLMDAISVSSYEKEKMNKAPSSQDKHDRLQSQNISECNQHIQALEILLKAPVGDLVYSTTWPHLQQQLCESLCDNEMAVFSLVLRLHAKLLSTSVASTSREGFFSLLEGLTLYYLSPKTCQLLPTMCSGIQLNNNVHNKMILMTKCALEGLCELPRKWVRFGEKRVQDILENFVDLLSMHTHSLRSFTCEGHGTVLYPLHLVSVLDPRATWCEAITHAAFGRTMLLRLMIKANSLLQFVMEEILLWLRSQMNNSNAVMFVYDDYMSGNVNGTMITLTGFMHGLFLIKTLITSDRGYSIFPIQTSIEQDPVTVYSLVLRTLSFLNTHGLSKNYSRRFLDFIEEAVAAFILNRGTKILSGRSSKLAKLLVEAPCKMPCLHKHNVRILNIISEVDTGVNWILGRPEKRIREVTSRPIGDIRHTHPSSAPASRKEITGIICHAPCLVFVIVDSTLSALKEKDILANSYEACMYVCQLLSLCGKLFGTIDGYLVLNSFENKLIQEAGNLYVSLCKIITNEGSKHHENFSTICVSLEQLFVKLAMTPLGFFAISNIDGLIHSLINSHLQFPLKAWHSPQFIHFMELTTTLEDNTLNILRRMLLSQIFHKLWVSLEDETKFMTMEEQSRKDTISSFLSLLLGLCSSPNVVAELLSEPVSETVSESSEETLVDEAITSSEPLSLGALLRNGLQQENPLHVHHVCLCTLHALAQHIDVTVVLLEKLNVQEHLTQLQMDRSLISSPNIRERNQCATASDNQPSPRKDYMIIQDENTIFRGHILDLVGQMRDGCTFNIQNISTLCKLASPRAQIRTARLRIQTDLQRFLQDTRHGLHDSMWLTHARRAYRMSCHIELKVCVLLDLLEQILRCQSAPPPLLSSWPSGAVKHFKTEYCKHAIQLVVRYGCHQKVLNSNMSTQYVEQLALLLDQAQMFIYQATENNGFDWFVASVFLMCSGNIDRSRSVLQRVAMLHIGPLLWPCLSQFLGYHTAALCHQLQGIIADFLPQQYNTLQAEGIPWWHTMSRMTQQGFLTAFPISQLPLIIAFYALHSSDYILYLWTAMLAHFKNRRPKTGRLGPYPCFLSEIQTDGLFISDFIPFVDRLAKLNRSSAGREKSVTSTL